MIKEFIEKYGFDTFKAQCCSIDYYSAEKRENMTDLLCLLESNDYDFSRPGYYQQFAGDYDSFQQIAIILKYYKEEGNTMSEPPRDGGDKMKDEVKISETFADWRGMVEAKLSEYAIENGDEEIRELSIDIETFSSEDIDNGVYRYADSDDFEILLFSYSVNRGPVQQVDLACNEKIPEKILNALTDSKIVKTAFNAAFERTCLTKYLNLSTPLDPREWECTMVRAAMFGLPMSLKQCGEVLNLKDKKMSEGVALIKYFSCPCKATKVNGGRTRNMPSDAPDKWETYKKYNRRDVEVEVAIRNIVDCPANPVTELERQLYVADQNINDRGVKIDIALMNAAIRLDDTYKGRLNAECQELTGLDNPNSAMQLKAWLGEKTGKEIKTLTKADYPKMLQGADGAVKRVLEIRTEMAKTSTTKYVAMRDALCKDGRVHGMLQFYGSRTGRWAGRIVQVQNLPQNHISDLNLAREITKQNDLGLLEMCYGNVPDILSQLIRTAFVADEGKAFIVCDFSAIEARVIAWLAGEEWRLDVFRGNGKIYEASASQMFGIPEDEITHDSPYRKKGKIAELALGYQGGPGALEKMGGEKFLKLFVDDKTLEGDALALKAKPFLLDIVENWRKASPSIPRLWGDIENAVKETLADGKLRRLRQGHLAVRRLGNDMIQIYLPTGRLLSYPKMHTVDSDYNKQKLAFMGMNQITHKWEEIETYGGKLTENIVQAIARDCLGQTIIRLEEAGYPVVFHIHDECICEVPDDGTKTLDEVQKIFRTPMPFAKDLPLKGAGYVTKYYLKD
jgi:DNA polymerase